MFSEYENLSKLSKSYLIIKKEIIITIYGRCHFFHNIVIKKKQSIEGIEGINMSDDIKPIIKYTFLVHFVIAAIFGFFLTFLPVLFGELFNWPYEELYFTRLAGGLMLGLGTTSFLAFRADSWEKIKIIVIGEIVWLCFGVGIQIYGIIEVISNFGIWANLVLQLGLLGAFGWGYFQQQK